MTKGIDIRTRGSGNIGATNVFRVIGTIPGILSFFLDFLKGFIPFYLGSKYFHINGSHLLLLSSFAIVGHDFSPFLKFKGGKGVATTFGLITALNLQVAIYVLLVWGISLIISGYVSLASILSYISVPVFISIFTPSISNIAFGLIFGFLGLIRHSQNIKRLRSREEHKMLKILKK